mgnify:CR=1 FL=1
MYINDEEVVSNKDFTIVEEMLATSSTILNNCYPKTWEDGDSLFCQSDIFCAGA